MGSLSNSWATKIILRLKVVVVFFLALCPVVALLGQGIVNFSNSPSAVGGEGAPVSDIDGTRIAGAIALAQLHERNERST
jgi:hypothetical protein